MRPLRYGEHECENDEHEGNALRGDTLYACPDCEDEAEDAYQDYREQRLKDEGF